MIRLIFSLILGLNFSSPIASGSNTGVNRRPDGILIKFDHIDEFSEHDFVHAYLIGLDEFPGEDVGLLFHFVNEVAELGLDTGFQYGHLLREIVQRGSLESFQCLYPHVQFLEDERFEVLLMVECVNFNQKDMLYYMMERGFDSRRFICKILALSEHLDIPHAILDTVGLVASRNAEVYTVSSEIYTDMLHTFLINESAHFEYEGLAEELVRRGANVARARAQIGDDLIEKIRKRYEEERPELTTFLEVLFRPSPATEFGMIGRKRKREDVFF